MNNQSKDKTKITADATTASAVVLRKCCACNKITDRKNLIRILKEHKTGNIIINPNNKQFGRSIYLCKDEICLKTAIKKKRLAFLTDEQIKQIQDIISR